MQKARRTWGPGTQLIKPYHKERFKMLCPRCHTSSIVYRKYDKTDIVAVCRAVRRCGWRMFMPLVWGESKPTLDKIVYKLTAKTRPHE